MVVINHDAPTVWIMLPNEDASEAHQNRANTRCSNGASVARRQRSNGESVTGSARALQRASASMLAGRRS